MMRNQVTQSPKQWLSRILGLSLILPLFALAGCQTDENVNSTIDNAFAVNPQSASDPGVAEPAEGCYLQRFRQPDAEITRKIDILFVIDTSGSIVEERDQIAAGVDAFITALPAEVDYQASVMLAHGSTTTRVGKLYSKGTEPIVLKSSELTVEEIKTHLRTKMANPHTDSSTDGGEAGLTSLNRALDDDRFDLAKSQGFFREDAALAVVFVADENDICAVYPEGVTPVVDTNNIEPGAAVRDCHRTAPARTYEGVVVTPEHSETITAELVLAKLRARVSAMPLVAGAVIYNNDSTMPHANENEIGYGYKEFVEAHNGIIVDMADGNYGDGLSRIGQLATLKMNLSVDFSLTNSDVDASSIVAKVDGESAAFAFDSVLNQVHLAQAGGPGSFVDISYCQVPEEVPLPAGGAAPMCLAGSFASKSSLKVGLSSNTGDAGTTTVINGLAYLGVPVTQYSDTQIISGQPTADGVTVLVVSRKVVLSATTPEYVEGVRQFIRDGGSVLGGFDGAAMMFSNFDNVYTAFSGRFENAFQLFDGSALGGGLLLPLTASTMHVTDSQDPLMAGVNSSLVTSGLRTAFAIENFDSDWLHVSATFVSEGYHNLVPAGTFPAVMKGRCGSGRVVLLMMNHLEAVTLSTDTALVVHNSLQWLIGNTN